jgi:outer membrane protein assembly factor BamE (lipoprotein component of BamABCDE complex)
LGRNIAIIERIAILLLPTAACANRVAEHIEPRRACGQARSDKKDYRMGKRGFVAIIGMGLALTACAGIREHRGFVLDTTLADGIQAGVDNKESVARTLGRPTFTGQFDPNDWYYVSRNTQQLAFRDPKVSRQTVLRVQFDQAGNVTSVQKTGKELIASVEPSGDETPTLGRKRSFFDELFGNIGTISQPGLPGASRQ